MRNCCLWGSQVLADRLLIRLEEMMSPRTIYLSKLFGLYLILVALPMMIHKQAVVDMVTALFRDPAMMFMLGLLTLVAGLAMVLAHNIWSGGALPVVVTIVGWLALIKGFIDRKSVGQG